MVKKLLIDPGHGGTDSGAVGNGLLEKVLTLNIGFQVRDYLLANFDGIEITMTRTSDVFPTLSDRTNQANRLGVDYFFSAHINSGGGTGYEDFIYSGLSDASTGAQKQNKVHAKVVPVLNKYGLRDRGKKKADLHVLRETAMDAILTEMAFIDTADSNLLKNEAFVREMSHAYAEGIADAMGLTRKQVVQPPTTGGEGEVFYRVVVASYKDKSNAEALVAELKAKGYSDTFISAFTK